MKSYPFNSKRNVVYAKHGMVATSEPKAAQIGIDILKKGGNAIDAAVAVAAALTVLEPTSNGIGGDNFAIVYHNNQLYGMNSSGPSPKKLTYDYVLKNHQEIPKYGVIPITVPGAVKGWSNLSKRFGNLKFKDLLEPAITCAKNGFVVSETVAYYWQRAFQIYKKQLTHEMYKPWFDTFTSNGVPPSKGDVFFLKDHAHTLELIAQTHGDAFYHGKLAKQIDTYVHQHQGFLSLEDLNDFQSSWVDPISTSYRDFKIWELPPNGQGLIALMGLNILNQLKQPKKYHIDALHHQIEATKLAFADGLHYISDPKHMSMKVSNLLSHAYAKKRAELINKEASLPNFGRPEDHGTVYLATADQYGNMVSMIQSNYMGFGSGIVIPHTGIALHNRGHNFSMDETKSNVLAPEKKPFHTIIPGFITQHEKAIGPFGVMGGFMQPQGHIQVLSQLIDFHQNPQTALDAPRWQWLNDRIVIVEKDFPRHLIEGLKKRGHDVKIEPDYGQFGRGQIILKDAKSNIYVGGTEKRADGYIAIY